MVVGEEPSSETESRWLIAARPARLTSSLACCDREVRSLNHRFVASPYPHGAGPLVRIALHHSGDVGFRAGRILLGDRRVEVVGLIDRSPTDDHDGRLERVDDWAAYDLVLTDDTAPKWVVARAAAAGMSCVTWMDGDDDGVPTPGAGIVVLCGANLASGIAPCLASHEVARAGSVSEITVAWTEPGSPLRSGEPLAFPDPVGGRWGRRQRPNAFVAPVPGDWAGAMVKITFSEPDNRSTRIVGVADLAPHLEAIALAAGALAVGSGAFQPGLRRPADAAEAYLAAALGVGLDVAAYSISADRNDVRRPKR